MNPAPRPARAAPALLASTQLPLIMDTAIVNVALPSVGADLGSGSAGLSWAADACLITLGGLLLPGGRAADLLGHRRVLLAGLGLLAAASAAGGLAGSTAVLVAARAVQGVGAALAAAAFALLLELFPLGPARHRALGAFAATGGLGGVLGAALPLVVVTASAAATADAVPGEAGLASGLVATSQQFGSDPGLAVLAAAATARGGPAARTAGFRAALLVGAAFAAVAAPLSARLPAPAPAPPRQDRVGGPR
ncbi:MFS transporter [Streptomyces sp. NPDC050856]|uniref:MFS transporter n=1 Tax=Streptomyces sp. NPDC050856 TaxID=3154939 RepID=UPI0033CBF4AC